MDYKVWKGDILWQGGNFRVIHMRKVCSAFSPGKGYRLYFSAVSGNTGGQVHKTPIYRIDGSVYDEVHHVIGHFVVYGVRSETGHSDRGVFLLQIRS